MNRVDLEAQVAERTGLIRQDVTAVFDAMIDIVSESLARGDDVKLVGFLTMKVRERPERPGRNPITGEKITIPPSRKLVCRAGSDLNRLINDQPSKVA